MPAMHIAKAFGVSGGAVLRHMRRIGAPTRTRGVPKGTVFKTKNGRQVLRHTISPDWSKRDAALAKEHGCTREWIRQLRKDAGEPRSGSMDWFVKYHEGKTTAETHGFHITQA